VSSAVVYRRSCPQGRQMWHSRRWRLRCCGRCARTWKPAAMPPCRLSHSAQKLQMLRHRLRRHSHTLPQVCSARHITAGTSDGWGHQLPGSRIMRSDTILQAWPERCSWRTGQPTAPRLTCRALPPLEPRPARNTGCRAWRSCRQRPAPAGSTRCGWKQAGGPCCGWCRRRSRRRGRVSRFHRQLLCPAAQR
jgi:hypothetical protein